MQGPEHDMQHALKEANWLDQIVRQNDLWEGLPLIDDASTAREKTIRGLGLLN
jgi:hypothetical protein